MVVSWILNKIAGDYNQRQINKILPLVKKINEIDKSWDSLSDEQIKAKTEEFKQRLQKWESLDDILPEAFAAVKQAAKRLVGTEIEVKGQKMKWDMVPYDVQLIGGIVLHQGKIAEMKTGEGKTLVATLPAYLNALEGKGVHIVTVNEYLAARDAQWMGYLYNWLGLSVWSVTKFTPLEQRRAEYEKDITYVENSELGFDYLRDNLAKSVKERVLIWRPLNYAIVDEVDSILIDEARTPLIISHPSDEPTEKYVYYAQIVKALQPCKGKKKKAKGLLAELLSDDKNEPEEECDYYIDEKQKTVLLTSRGIKKLEEILKVDNLYRDLGYQEIHHIENALKAQAVYLKDKDYIVRDGEVLIVDEHTWRTMPGRRYSEWLHQAIEAKEWVEIQRESKTLATITYQHFFKQYKKLAWMTGTATTEGEEFEKIYGLEVISIPTNKPVIRVDKPDKVFFDQNQKWQQVLKNIKFYHQIGQPILIGTSSINTSEYVSSLLRKANIPHYVLNAKYHEQEAQIVANAGKKWSVVVATNMAWRGTDIKLESWLNQYLAQNYAKWISSQIKQWKGVSGVVYSQKEFELTIDALREQFGFKEDDIIKAEKWERVTAGDTSIKIKFNLKKKEKEDPFAEILIRPAKEEEPQLEKIDIHYGLFILGTEKHESRRIDNQLRGRAGRQWDPGVSQFFVALDDELMRKVWWGMIQGILSKFGGKDMDLSDGGYLASHIERAQKQMEAWHYSIRRHLYDYDSVISKQRERIYDLRDKILFGEEEDVEWIFAQIKSLIDKEVQEIVDLYGDLKQFKADELINQIKEVFGIEIDLQKFQNIKDSKKLKQVLVDEISKNLEEKFKDLPREWLSGLLKRIYLNVIDRYWIDHIDDMQYLRDKVSLYGYAQQDPLVIYKKEAFNKFQKLLSAIRKEFLSRTFKTDFSFLAQQHSELSDTTEWTSWRPGVINILQQGAQQAASMPTPSPKKTPQEEKQDQDDGIEVIENFVESTLDDGTSHLDFKNVGPNDPCPCGSGKKFKKCHWKYI